MKSKRGPLVEVSVDDRKGVFTDDSKEVFIGDRKGVSEDHSKKPLKRLRKRSLSRELKMTSTEH